jgi:hypothetical protein
MALVGEIIIFKAARTLVCIRKKGKAEIFLSIF